MFHREEPPISREEIRGALLLARNIADNERLRRLTFGLPGRG